MRPRRTVGPSHPTRAGGGREKERSHLSGRHTYRVIVRGTWDALTGEARARLLAEAARHGPTSMRFTEEGSLS